MPAQVFSRGSPFAICCAATKLSRRDRRMVEGAFKAEAGRRPPSGNWRAVVSAWVVAILALLALAGYQALASRHDPSPHAQSLAGAVIPQHDPTCSGPIVPHAGPGEGCRAWAAPYGEVPPDSGW